MGRAAVLWATLLVACSSDSGSDGESGGACGVAGCACSPDQDCDPGFECPAAVSKCVPADCQPGFADCVCAEGNQCTVDLICDDGLCVPGVATSTATTDGSGSTAGPTSDATGPGETTESGPSTMDESTGPVESSTGEPTCADEADCEACLACATVAVGPCATQSSECADDEQCNGLFTCVSNCAAMEQGSQCVNQCCGLFENGGDPPYADLAACVDDACSSLCPGAAC